MERRGLILVTGITGSGKSTTLAAMIDFMNRNRNDHIVTIEDPIEFVHEDKKCVISQREIGQDSASFAQALRAALREDPDIILVGEMRDAETMEVALHAAETGHLVLSTLHTLNATETINRIISTFPPHQEDQIRDQLAAVIQGIVSQRLVVRADGKGRVPAVEVMVGTGLIRDCIRDVRQDVEDPHRHRRGPGAVRHADVRPVAAAALPRGVDHLRDRARRRHQPRRLRPQGEGHPLHRRDDVGCEQRRARRRRRGHAGAAPRRGGEQPLPASGDGVPGRRSRAARARRAAGRSTPRPRGWRPSIFSRARRGAARELTRRLERRGAPADVAARGRGRARRARGYLDDEAFARWWAEARARGRRVGSVRLRQELLAKGISARAGRRRRRRRVRGGAGAASGPSRRAGAGCAALCAGQPRAGRRPGCADYLLRRGYPRVGGRPGGAGRCWPRRDAGTAVPDSADDDGGGAQV